MEEFLETRKEMSVAPETSVDYLQSCAYQDCVASDFDDWSDVRHAEGITRSTNNIPELRKWDLVVLDELANDFHCQVLEGEGLP